MTNEQNVIAANAAYIEELIRDVDRLEKSRDYVTNEMNRECNKLVAAEKELQEAQVKNLDLEVKNLDLEFELEYTQKQLKAANESSEGLTQDVIQSEKNIADLREECDRLTDSNKALRLALELKQLNGPDVSELKKEIRQLQDQNDELTRMPEFLSKKMNLDQNALSEMLNISRLKLAIAEEGGDCENLARIADESIRFAIYQLEDIQDAIDDIKEALKLDVIVTDDEADE